MNGNFYGVMSQDYSKDSKKD